MGGKLNLNIIIIWPELHFEPSGLLFKIAISSAGGVLCYPGPWSLGH